jgi:hypothetical protein
LTELALEVFIEFGFEGLFDLNFFFGFLLDCFVGAWLIELVDFFLLFEFGHSAELLHCLVHFLLLFA